MDMVINLKSFSYKNDRLILDKSISKTSNYITAYNLINKKKSPMFENDVLNIFSALIKTKDFKRKLPLHHTPYIYLNKNYIERIINKIPKYYSEKNHLNIR